MATAAVMFDPLGATKDIMNILKKVIVGVVILYGYNLMTLYIFGQASIAKRLARDSHTTFRRTPSPNEVNILYDLNFNKEDAERLKDIYQGTPTIAMPIKVSELADLAPYLHKNQVHNHVLLFDSYKLIPLLTVNESENLHEYVQWWQIKYIWLLTDWVKIKDEDGSIS